MNEHKEAGLKKMQSFTPEGLGGFAQPPSPYQPAEARALSAAVLPAQPSQVAFARGVPHAAPSVVAERSARPTRDLAVESARVPPALDKTKMARKQNQGLVPFAIQVFMSDHVDRTLTEKTGFPLERFPDRWAQRFEWASNLKVGFSPLASAPVSLIFSSVCIFEIPRAGSIPGLRDHQSLPESYLCVARAGTQNFTPWKAEENRNECFLCLG